MKVALIPCAPSEWRAQGRLLGRVELAPVPEAGQRCAQWVEQLRPAMLTRIFHAPDELSRTAAERVGRGLGIPIRLVEELAEVDVGLWAGLTEEDLEVRFAKAHRQLADSPLNVSPPEGEAFAAAVVRLRSCLKRRIKPNGKAPLGLVTRPLALAMARYILTAGSGPGSIWETSQRADEPEVLEVSGVPEPPAGG